MDEANNVEQTVMEELLEAIKRSNPAFALRSREEGEQPYLKRMVKALHDMSDSDFDKLSDDAADWHHTAVRLLNTSKPVTTPDGFEQVMQQQAAERESKEASGKGRRSRADREAPAEAQAAQSAAEPRRRRRAAAATPADEAAVATETEAAEAAEDPAAAEAAAPESAAQHANGANGASTARKSRRQRRKEEAAIGQPTTKQARRRKEGFTLQRLRKRVIEDPTLTVDKLMAEATQAGAKYSPASIQLIRTSTLNMIEMAKETGHWR